VSLEVLNLALAGYMAGVIWVVQRVHYPLFAHYGAFAPAMLEHQRRITPVVGPPMGAQVVVAALLLADAATGLAWANAALVAVAFGSTGLYFGPLHGRLTPEGVRRLVAANWLRTAAWTAQLVVAALMV
jgi:hypothetical protein